MLAEGSLQHNEKEVHGLFLITQTTMHKLQFYNKLCKTYLTLYSDLIDLALWQLFSDLVSKRIDGNFTITQTFEENFKKPLMPSQKKKHLHTRQYLNIERKRHILAHKQRTLLLTTGRQLQRSLRFSLSTLV